jgi:hypothetical protein
MKRQNNVNELTLRWIDFFLIREFQHRYPWVSCKQTQPVPVPTYRMILSLGNTNSPQKSFNFCMIPYEDWHVLILYIAKKVCLEHMLKWPPPASKHFYTPVCKLAMASGNLTLVIAATSHRIAYLRAQIIRSLLLYTQPFSKSHKNKLMWCQVWWSWRP